MEGYLTFQWGEGFIFKWGVHPMGGICFDGGGGVKKIVEWGGGGGTRYAPLTMGNPGVSGLSFCLLAPSDHSK